MTREEFFKRKIFFKESIPVLRRQYPELIDNINAWLDSDDYASIQKKKSFLENKLKDFKKREEIEFDITPQLLYDLYNWWKAEPKKCRYCSLTQEDMHELHGQLDFINKRRATRGFSLEIDRKNSGLAYTIIDNLVLSCYWCNNAKTDTFTEEEFVRVGQVFKTIWETRLNRQLDNE